jgi:hypothetical protein
MTDVLISHSRKDRIFVERLCGALTPQQREAWVDCEGIPYSAEWWEEIRAGISRSPRLARLGFTQRGRRSPLAFRCPLPSRNAEKPSAVENPRSKYSPAGLRIVLTRSRKDGLRL